MQLLAPLVLLGLMYMFLIRPQQLRAKRQRELIVSLAVGDRVLTVGGMIGTIVAIDGDEAEIEIGHGVVATFVRPAISRRLDPEPDTELEIVTEAPTSRSRSGSDSGSTAPAAGAESASDAASASEAPEVEA